MPPRGRLGFSSRGHAHTARNSTYTPSFGLVEPSSNAPNRRKRGFVPKRDAEQDDSIKLICDSSATRHNLSTQTATSETGQNAPAANVSRDSVQTSHEAASPQAHNATSDPAITNGSLITPTDSRNTPRNAASAIVANVSAKDFSPATWLASESLEQPALPTDFTFPPAYVVTQDGPKPADTELRDSTNRVKETLLTITTPCTPSSHVTQECGEALVPTPRIPRPDLPLFNARKYGRPKLGKTKAPDGNENSTPTKSIMQDGGFDHNTSTTPIPALPLNASQRTDNMGSLESPGPQRKKSKVQEQNETAVIRNSGTAGLVSNRQLPRQDAAEFTSRMAKMTKEEKKAELDRAVAEAVAEIGRQRIRGNKKGYETGLDVLERARKPPVGNSLHMQENPACVSPNPGVFAESSELASSFQSPQKLETMEQQVNNGQPANGKSNERKNKWATAKEIKPDDTGSNDWGSESPQAPASCDSNRVLVHGHHIERIIPEFEPQLADFDGTSFAPAPVDWDNRPVFDNRQQWFTESIEDWIMTFSEFNFSGAERIKADRFPPDVPMFRDGTAHADGNSMFKLDITHPATLLDPSDELSRKHGHETVEMLVRNHMAHMNKGISDTTHAKEQYRANVLAYRPPPNPHKPKANIYIRPAELRDADAITDIMNWYISNSCRMTDVFQLSPQEIRRRINDCAREELPFLVAIERNVQRQFNNFAGEKIVGYALATDFVGRQTTDKYTAEMELFVHPDYLRQGIGKSLMDKLLNICDTGYLPRRGYMFTCDKADAPKYECGGNRYLITLIFVLRFLRSDPKDYNWIKEWLVSQWDFEEQGIINDISVKWNRYVNASYLVKRAGFNPTDGAIP